MHHIVTGMCTHVHIAVTYGALRDIGMVHCGFFGSLEGVAHVTIIVVRFIDVRRLMYGSSNDSYRYNDTTLDKHAILCFIYLERIYSHFDKAG